MGCNVQDKAYTYKTNQIGLMEPWISSKEICAFLGISKRTLINHTNKKYFTRGTHWRYKDPLNENSHKVWKRSAVDHLLSQPTNVLKRRVQNK